MQANDELAALFARNLTLQSLPPQVPDAPRAPESEPITYSISQHYTHSAHVIHQDEPPQERERPSSEPPQTQQPGAELILSSHGVDPSTLSPSQMELFKTAEDSQKARLIELWRICPPSNRDQNPAVAWSMTTVEQETLLAQLRFERKLAEEEQMHSNMSLDGTPLTPIQTTDSHWVTAYQEPYMISGYEQLARREYEASARQQNLDDNIVEPKGSYSHFGSAANRYRPATDPVYKNDWNQKQMAMEDQYGQFQMGGEMEL